MIIKKYRSINYLKLLIAALFVVLPADTLTAQYEGADARGKDFWLTFLPNFHNYINMEEPRLRNGDSIYIFISAVEPTNGQLEFINPSGQIETRPFSIPDPSQLYIFQFNSLDYELKGYVRNGLPAGQPNDNERVTKKYFHITTDKKVSVYAHTQAVTTSDGFLVMPTPVFGSRYYILSYNSHVNTPSQFAIIASEDSTSILIKPSAPTRYNGAAEQRITLNKGETYLVQALINSNNPNTDLSGTEVIANKPVAIFSGHQRSAIPYTETSSDVSRDCLVEQLIPMEYWGRNYLLMPFVPGRDQTVRNNDIYRVIAGYDGTELTINGDFIKQMNQGEIHEGILNAPLNIKTSAPSMVGAFKKTSKVNTAPFYSGDPFFMIMPPIEQYHNYYRVINIQSSEYRNSRYEPVYDEHYLGIIGPDSALAYVTIDGNTLNLGSAVMIPQSGYSYINVRVTQGIHTIESDVPIGLIIYGYGPANSYGYIGGLARRILDHNPPVQYAEQICFVLSGIVTDSTFFDSKLESASILPASIVNADVSIESIVPFQDSVRFNAELIDEYLDGSFVLTAKDSMGISSTKKHEIPGFTVSIEDARNSRELVVIEQTMLLTREYCFDVILENYGKFPQEVSSMHFRNYPDRFVFDETGIIILQPGEIDTVEVCYSPAEEGTINDTLVILGTCISRPVYAVRSNAWNDTDSPVLSGMPDPCAISKQIFISDTAATDFGLQSISVYDTVNCTYTYEENFPDFAVYKISISDPYQDAFYTISALDSNNQETTYTDTIQGFTLEFVNLADANSKIDFGDSKIGSKKCQTIKLHNYGSKQIKFDQADMNENTIFSVPPSQLPITVLSGETVSLEICFRPILSENYEQLDTLGFMFNCLDKKLPTIGLGTAYAEDVDTDCDVPIRIGVSNVPDVTFLEQNSPNPADGITTILFAKADEGNAIINIYDMTGDLIDTIADGVFAPGYYEIHFDTAGLRQGIYIYELITKNDVISKSMMIVK